MHIHLCRFRFRYRYKYANIHIIWEAFLRCCETSRPLNWNGFPLRTCERVCCILYI